jgi:hypothetical protein
LNIQRQEKKALVIDNPCIDQIQLVFPEDRTFDALAALDAPGGEDDGVDQHTHSGRKLARLLQRLGWECAERNNGSLVLTAYTGLNLDLDHDPVLVHAVGLVQPGSFVLGHFAHEQSPSWWVSYTAQARNINWGLPTEDQVVGLLVCPACGSMNPSDWHHIQYTAIRYPVQSVNPLQIVTSSSGEVLYECVSREYLECACGEQLARNGRDYV